MGQTKIFQAKFMCWCFVACAALFAYYSWLTKSWLSFLIIDALFVICVAAALICWDISTLNPADSHTWKTLLPQYIVTKILVVVGRLVYSDIIRSSKDVATVQETFLLAILRKNAKTLYGIQHGFEHITCRESFRRSHPLTTYSHYEEYIQKIQQTGRQHILTKDRVVFLAYSSGTTGKRKIIPITTNMKGPTARNIGPLMYYVMNQKVTINMQRVLVLSFKAHTQLTASGLVIGPVSTHMRRYMPYLVSPRRSYDIDREQTALHVHAVFGLQEREVGNIEVLMSTLMYSFWKYIEEHWTIICDDIESGHINADLTDLDQTIKSGIEEKLKPQPERAKELREYFKEGFCGIAKKIWPNLTYVRMMSTGSFAHHAKLLRQQHLQGVYQFSEAHVATEGFMGFNISTDPDNFTYTALVKYGLLEFIHEDNCSENQPNTLFAEQVEEGQQYEIVLTCPMGLYRYRTGDVVKIVEHLNQCPVYEFQYRLGQTLNVAWEKTPESLFYQAVLEAVDKLKLILIDYTATEDLYLRNIHSDCNSKMQHYVLFLELGGDYEKQKLSVEQAAEFDDTLCAKQELYADLRANGCIGQMKVLQVCTGGFMRLKFEMTETTQNQQFKLPRVLRNEEYLKFLWDQGL